MGRGNLSDEQWQRLAPLLPARKPPAGRPAKGNAFKPDDPNVIFAAVGDTAIGSTGAIQRSTDAGETWGTRPLPVERNSNIWNIVTHPPTRTSSSPPVSWARSIPATMRATPGKSRSRSSAKSGPWSGFPTDLKSKVKPVPMIETNGTFSPPYWQRAVGSVRRNRNSWAAVCKTGQRNHSKALFHVVVTNEL